MFNTKATTLFDLLIVPVLDRLQVLIVVIVWRNLFAAAEVASPFKAVCKHGTDNHRGLLSEKGFLLWWNLLLLLLLWD
jgi:hypothetical protein